MLLVLAGTTAQRELGIQDVQRQYFHSWFSWIEFQQFLPLPNPGGHRVGGGFWMLGGYSLIILLLANLLAAHSVRFKLKWKRSGILLIHFGLILLLVGELIS